MLQERIQALLLLDLLHLGSMKILYISQYFPPEMGAPAARAVELSRHWAAAGHDVTVLTGFPNHPTGVVPPEYRDKVRRLVAHEQTDGVNVVRTWLLPFPNRKAYERMLNYSSFCASAAITGLFLSRPDVVIRDFPTAAVSGTPWLVAGLVGSACRLSLKCSDLWPESLAAVGMGGENSPLHLRALAKGLPASCTAIPIGLSSSRPPSKITLVEHWRVPREKILGDRECV